MKVSNHTAFHPYTLLPNNVYGLTAIPPPYYLWFQRYCAVALNQIKSGSFRFLIQFDLFPWYHASATSYYMSWWFHVPVLLSLHMLLGAPYGPVCLDIPVIYRGISYLGILLYHTYAATQHRAFLPTSLIDPYIQLFVIHVPDIEYSPWAFYRLPAYHPQPPLACFAPYFYTADVFSRLHRALYHWKVAFSDAYRSIRAGISERYLIILPVGIPVLCECAWSDGHRSQAIAFHYGTCRTPEGIICLRIFRRRIRNQVRNQFDYICFGANIPEWIIAVWMLHFHQIQDPHTIAMWNQKSGTASCNFPFGISNNKRRRKFHQIWFHHEQSFSRSTTPDH